MISPVNDGFTLQSIGANSPAMPGSVTVYRSLSPLQGFLPPALSLLTLFLSKLPTVFSPGGKVRKAPTHPGPAAQEHSDFLSSS